MILRKGGRRVAKQGEVFQMCCRWFTLLAATGISYAAEDKKMDLRPEAF